MKPSLLPRANAVRIGLLLGPSIPTTPAFEFLQAINLGLGVSAGLVDVEGSLSGASGEEGLLAGLATSVAVEGDVALAIAIAVDGVLV